MVGGGWWWVVQVPPSVLWSTQLPSLVTTSHTVGGSQWGEEHCDMVGGDRHHHHGALLGLHLLHHRHSLHCVWCCLLPPDLPAGDGGGD